MDTNAKSVRSAAERDGQRKGYEPGWARMAPSLAPTPSKGSLRAWPRAQRLQEECSQLPSANSKAGWLAGSADLLENSYPLPAANNGASVNSPCCRATRLILRLCFQS